MSCQGCKSHVTKALENIPEVEQVEVDLEKGTAEISMSKHIKIEEFQQALKNAGGNYQISMPSETNSPEDSLMTHTYHVSGMSCNGCRSHVEKTLNEVEKILIKEKPDYFIVQGDTNTAMAGCLACSIYNRKYRNLRDKIKIIHIEAGLRSFDETMPEEINRTIIDKLSDVLFVPTDFDVLNIKKENLSKNKKIIKVGNTITDIVKSNLPLLKKNKILKKMNLKKKNFFLATLHRPETVDNFFNLKKIILTFEKIVKIYNLKIIFPVHPRTQKILKKIKIKFKKNILFIKPLEYLNFLSLVQNSKIVLTDSGGIQEEASILGTPCITTRTTTERQITILKKINILTGYNETKILKAVKKFLNYKPKKLNLFGNGNTGKKIYNYLKKKNL